MPTKAGSGEGARVERFLHLVAALHQNKEENNSRWEKAHRKLCIENDVHESWKKIKGMCVDSTDTAFAQHLLSLEVRRRMAGLVFTLIIGFPLAL